MTPLSSADFTDFFFSIHGHAPFPWQSRLLEQVVDRGGWPSCIDLPTASGKTAALDVAVFAMALTGRGPRRVFFVVDRRIVVDAAHQRMVRIAAALAAAQDGVLRGVADRLRAMGGDASVPLGTCQLRGGIYRDDSWVRSPLQPLLAASTVDQTGSRLLFRGYGVCDQTLSIHAALVANDALILLDEAHCSNVFAETAAAVEEYRSARWNTSSFSTPFVFTEMTATPTRNSDDVFRLEDVDLNHPVLRARLHALKPVTLEISAARPKDPTRFAKDLVTTARKCSEGRGIRRIGIIVNRVKTARAAHRILRESGLTAHLLIGRMRPADRIELDPGVQALLSGAPRFPEAEPVFVVSTQCLEVGADLDFDALVTECASVDALLQRFGRLDRVGNLAASGLTAQGVIVVSAGMTNEAYVDPIYGTALAKTWNWLSSLGGPLNFAICSADGASTVRERLAIADASAAGLRKQAPQGPVLLPVHLDQLVQTSPRPALEPDPALFLHGLSKGSPEVQVLWRADLDARDLASWAERVASCPPVSAEAMPVPLRDFRAWLSGALQPDASDIEGEDEPGADPDEPTAVIPTVLRWRGDDSDLFGAGVSEHGPGAIQPGDTFVVPAGTGGWQALGHIPETALKDVAESARRTLRRAWVLRLHPALIRSWWPKADETCRTLLDVAADPAAEREALLAALREHAALLPSEMSWLREMIESVPARLHCDAYPQSDSQGHAGWVLSEDFAEADAGHDEASASRPVALPDHLAHVTARVQSIAQGAFGEGGLQCSLVRAAQHHDCGKADIRFQALLHGGDPGAARFSPVLRAKGPQVRGRTGASHWKRSGLPDGFRHELISLLLVRSDSGIAADDLALHLIASHHGRCRPFAPFVDDCGGPLRYDYLTLAAGDRMARAAHRLDSGVADRFWRLTRQYGWWGLAYLESLLRLGDWKASRDECDEEAAK
jgi:CRISPR-associated endonuclease/helicase Cas3